MDISTEMNLEQNMKVSPTLIAVNTILALSSQELQTVIRQEAEENPAFEIVEHQTCPVCGEPLHNGVCLNCRQPSSNSRTSSDVSDDFNFGSLGYQEEGFGSKGFS